MRQFILPFYTERSQHRTKGGNVTQKIMNISNIHPTSDILCANYLWFSGGISLLNNADYLTYLFIKLVKDIFDITSYNRDKFILSVTIVSKEIMKTSFTLTKSYWKMTRCLWQCCDLSHTKGRLKNKKGCSADVNRLGNNLKTSFGWSYGHQHHVLLAKLLIYFWFSLFFFFFL